MRSTILIGLALAAALAAGPTAAGAQNSLPGLENFTLERPQPPRPSPTPTPVPSETPAPAATPVPVPPPAVLPTAAPATAPSPRATRPAASPTPAPAAATPAPAIATPAATPTPLPTVIVPTPPITPPPVEGDGGSGWPLWLGIAALVAAVAAAGWWWRRRQAVAEDVWAEPPEPEPVPAVAPPPPAAPIAPAPSRPPGGLITTALRPALAIDVRPAVAAIDALRASVDFELAVANTGRAPAYDVAIESWLIGAGGDPAADLVPLFAAPPGDLLMPPFTLPPSANADLAAQLTVQRELLPTITAGERRLFVPLVAVRATYHDGRGQLVTVSAAFLIGAAPAGQDRLAPLPLDRGTRTYRTLAARRFEG